MDSNSQLFAPNPEDIPALFVEAWNRRDPDGIANLFVEDAEFVNVVGLWWHNRKAIRKAHDYGLRVIFPDSEVSVRRSKVRLLGDAHAVVHARMKLEGQRQIGGETAGERNTIFSFVVEKRELGWVCISAHNTDQVPGMETNLVNRQGALEAVDYRK